MGRGMVPGWVYRVVYRVQYPPSRLLEEVLMTAKRAPEGSCRGPGVGGHEGRARAAPWYHPGKPGPAPCGRCTRPPLSSQNQVQTGKSLN